MPDEIVQALAWKLLILKRELARIGVPEAYHENILAAATPGILAALAYHENILAAATPGTLTALLVEADPDV